MLDLTAGIVTHNSDFSLLKETVETFHACPLAKELIIHDNSSTVEYQQKLNSLRTKETILGLNEGFGYGHNQIIQKASGSKYHLVLNPDVEIPTGTLEKMITHMDTNPDIGLMVPKILNPDKSIQLLNKRPPSFFNLFARRFLPGFIQRWQPILTKMDHYIMLDKGYDSSYEVPYMSGCFMLFRTDTLKELNGFDERFFMYLEDADITRRAAEISKCLYYSEASIIHHWSRGSHKA